MVRPDISIIFFLVVFFLSPAVTTVSATTDSENKKHLFSPLSLKEDRTHIVQKDKTIKRQRFVQVDFNELVRSPEIPKKIILNLFDDKVFTAIYDRTPEKVLRGIGWIGHLEGVDRSQVILIMTDGMLTGSVSMPGGLFRVRGTGNEVHIVEEVDPSQFPEESEPVVPPVVFLEETFESNKDVYADGGEGCADITVLVAYTPEARSAAGGTQPIEDLIELAVQETNQSYINSGINARLTLVHTMETQPGEAANNFSQDLNSLYNTYDSTFTAIDNARNQYYADEVALIIEDSQYCGLGYLDSSASSAFTVTHRTCATGYYSFGHEIGHNMGARHDWYVDDANASQKGYVNADDRWRTIMGYNSRCSASGFNCQRLQYWSNPAVSYGGDPMGVTAVGPKNCVEGSLSPNPSSCAADNRSKINETCSAVANFRAASSVVPDLTVSLPVVEVQELEPNVFYSITLSVNNIGSSTAPSTTLRYYQSLNSTISMDDTLLGTDSVSSLAVAASKQKSIEVYAPSSEGTYYVGACVESVLGEVEVSNNCSIGTPITVTNPITANPPAPDLTVVSASINKKEVGVGETSVLSLTVANYGNASAQSTTLRYYRSLDGVISAADTSLGVASVTALDQQESSGKSLLITAPTIKGVYWFGGCVDAVADEGSVYQNCSSAVKLSVGVSPFSWNLLSPIFGTKKEN
jgi:hypothetical protein